MSGVKSIEEQTKANLTLSLQELNIANGQELTVADQTNPNPVLIRMKFTN